jgi:hypothetical protein
MALIKIFWKTILLVVAGIIAVTGVLTEGIGRFFGKLTEYLDTAVKWLVEKSDLKIGKMEKPGRYESK